MTTTADNLARALRETEAALSRHFGGTCNGTEIRAALNARAALAEYDSAAPVVSVADVAREMRRRAAKHRAKKRYGRAAELDQFAARLES